MVLNNMIYDILEQVCGEASRMVGRTNKKTLSSSDLQFAIKTLFPKELAKHAVTEGILAVARSEGMQQE
jgi:histone H2B